MVYFDENRRLFDEAISSIPGLVSMPLEATYLAWVDFSALELSSQEITDRIHKTAKLATNLGHTFGLGGDNFHRFNLATPRSILLEAIERFKVAFADLA